MKVNTKDLKIKYVNEITRDGENLMKESLQN